MMKRFMSWAAMLVLAACTDVGPMGIASTEEGPDTGRASDISDTLRAITPAACPAGGEAPYVWASANTDPTYETDDGLILTSHAIAIGLTPATDTLCNPWRWSVRPQQVDAVIPGVTVVKDIVGRYTDTEGNIRVTRHDEAWRGYTLETPEGRVSDRWEGLYLDCASEVWHFPAQREPDSHIDVTVHYVVQYAEREEASPSQVRPLNRRDSLQLVCPLPGIPLVDVEQEGNWFQLVLNPRVDGVGRQWTAHDWSVTSTGTEVYGNGVTVKVDEGWELVPGTPDLGSSQWRVRCDEDLQHDIEVEVRYSLGRLTRPGGNPTEVVPRARTGTVTYTCAA